MNIPNSKVCLKGVVHSYGVGWISISKRLHANVSYDCVYIVDGNEENEILSHQREFRCKLPEISPAQLSCDLVITRWAFPVHSSRILCRLSAFVKQHTFLC